MMLSDYVSSISSLTHTHTHTHKRSEREENYFDLTSIMTEGQKYYFIQIRILIIFSFFFILSRSGHPHVYEFCVLSLHLPYLLPSLDRSAPDVNNSTYICEVYLCCTQKARSTSSERREILNLINNITSLISFLIPIFNTHNLPMYNRVIREFVFLCSFFFPFLPLLLSTQAGRASECEIH